MRELDQIATGLFDKIRSRFEDINLGDETAKRTSDPAVARFFNFDYVSRLGKNYGNVTINIADNHGFKIYYSKNITDGLEESDQDEWFNFLRDLRKFAKSNFMTFDARDINKSGLDLRDIQQQAKSDGTFVSDEVAMTESWDRMSGSARYSFQNCGPVRIRIKHSANVDEDKRGDRSRNIEAIYIEHENGERRLLPHCSLSGARAMAQHCAAGGTVDDALGSSITELVTEMGSMVHFVRAAKHRQFEDADTGSMARSAVKHYHEVRKQLHKIGHPRGYRGYSESFVPAPDMDESVDVGALRERFSRRTYDDRLDAALPYVYRAYQRDCDRNRESDELSEEFESWANALTESEYEQGQKEDAIRELMSAPIEVGIDAIDARGAISPMFDSGDLMDKLTILADLEGPGADARQLIINWMQHNGMAQLAAEIQDQAVSDQEQQLPSVPDTEPQEQPAAETASAPPIPQMENTDPVVWMQRFSKLLR
jgi:hypothetical protein